MNLYNTHSTAVLIFALSTAEELQRKKMVKGERLFDALTEHTLQTVKKTGLPFFHLTEQQQYGSSFGERFTNAIQDVFDLGYEKVITIGNDSPHLNKSHFANTLSNLELNKSVIGPSADGGFYLLGLHRANFTKDDFKGLSWQTSKLQDEIVTVLYDRGNNIALLSTLADIDTLWDAQIVGQNPTTLTPQLTEAVRLLICCSNKKVEFQSFLALKTLYIATPHNKGSPDFCTTS